MNPISLALLLTTFISIAIWAGVVYSIYCLIKHLIRYNIEYKDRYRQYREAEQEAAKLEAELEYMATEYDWSKEP